MKSPIIAALAGAVAFVLATGGASAEIVCNDEGECWHVKERHEYKPN